MPSRFCYDAGQGFTTLKTDTAPVRPAVFLCALPSAPSLWAGSRGNIRIPWADLHGVNSQPALRGENSRMKRCL